MPDIAELSAIWPSLKLFGERGLLLLRFRPRTVLPLVRNPEHALEIECALASTCEQASVFVTHQ